FSAPPQSNHLSIHIRFGGHDFWIGLYGRLLGEKSPVFGVTTGSSYRGDVATTCDWVLLPQSSNGNDVDRCLELEDWNNWTEQGPDEAGGTRWRITVY
ncbi:MAG: hypothetical protein ACREIB_08930, partial [Pseudomonadota bacterium]